jgi:hypothetical protein
MPTVPAPRNTSFRFGLHTSMTLSHLIAGKYHHPVYYAHRDDAFGSEAGANGPTLRIYLPPTRRSYGARSTTRNGRVCQLIKVTARDERLPYISRLGLELDSESGIRMAALCSRSASFPWKFRLSILVKGEELRLELSFFAQT